MRSESPDSTRPRASLRTPSLSARLLPKLAVSLVLGGLFAWLAERGGVPIVPPAAAFTKVRWSIVLFAFVLLLVLSWFRATRWRFLIAPVKKLPLRDVVELNWVGFFAIFALPLRLGELARPALGKLRAGVPVSAGIGTVAVERVVDGAITSLCVVWALWALPRLPLTDPVVRIVPVYAGVVLAVFSGAMVALAGFLWKRSWAVRFTQSVFRLVSPKLGEFVARKVDSVADGLRSIGDAKLAAGFLLETLIYWGTNACFMWVLGIASGVPMHLGHAVAVMGVLALGILLPSGPGLFGAFQMAASVALKLYFPESLVASEGAVFVFLLYGLNALAMVLLGVPPLLHMHVRLSDIIAPRLDSELPPPPLT